MKSRLFATRYIVPTLLALQVAGAQIREPAVPRSSIWIDTVKRGDMVREVRGLVQLRGTTGSVTAILKVAATQATEIKVGQAAKIDTGRALVAGTVAGVSSPPIDGMVDVEIKPSSALPEGAISGTAIDGRSRLNACRTSSTSAGPSLGAPEAPSSCFDWNPAATMRPVCRYHLGEAQST